MEKILLRVDELQATRLINIIESEVIYAANEILKAYEELFIGAGDKNTLLDIALHNAIDTEKKYFNALNKELDKMKVNVVLRKRLLKGWQERIRGIIEIATKFEAQAQYFKFLTVTNGKAILSQDDKNRIRERFTLYVQSEPGIEAYKTAKKIADSLNVLLALVKKNNGPTFYNFEMIAGLFFRFDVNSQSVSLSDIDYDFIANSK